jgi:hypothetical protein
MATTITLKVKDEDGNIKNQQHSIEDIDLIQFEGMMHVIKEIMNKLNNDSSLKELFSSIFSEEFDTENVDEKTLMKMDKNVLAKAVNSFETIAIHMPQQAFKLLSVLSDIDLDLLRKQKFKDVLDIYDAVLEENDIEVLIARLKKSLALTAAKFKFKNLVQKATQKVQNQKAQ